MERVLGQASVDIRANDKLFLRDLQRMLKKIKDQSLNAILNVDTTQAQKQLDDFKKGRSDSLEIKVSPDFKDAEKKINDFKTAQSKKKDKINLSAKVTFKEARQDLADFKAEVEKRAPLNIKAKMTFAQARKDLKDFKDNQKPVGLTANLELDPTQARETIEDFRNRYMNSAPVILQATMAFGLARTQIAAFRKEQDGRKITVIVDANTNPARRAIRSLENTFAREPIIAPTMLVNPHTGEVIGKGYNPTSGMGAPSPINIPVNIDDSDAFDSIDVLNRRIQGLKDQGINFPIRVSTDKFDREVLRLDQKLRAYDLGMEILAKPRLSDQDIVVLRRQINRTFPELGDQMAVELSKKISRRLTGRNNPFGMMFRDSELSNAMKGFSSTITGVVPFDIIKENILDVVGGMEGLSIQAGMAATAAGGIGTALFSASGFAANLVTDLGQIAGLLALAPAAFAANKIRVWTKDMAFAGMQTAIFSNNMKAVKEALAGMTPIMRHAAEYLRDFFGQISDATQNSYWDQMGMEIQVTAEILKGSLIKNFSRMGEVMALNHIEVLKQLVAFHELGRFDATFVNIVDAFENMREGMGLTTEALLRLTFEGSKKLPDLANRLTGLAESFNNFVKVNSENGNILKWIDVAFQRLGELGSIVGNTIETLVAVGEAAEQAGLGGLTDLANAVEYVSEYVNNANFQSLMIDVFRDSRIAAQELAEGLSHLWDGLIAASPQFTQMMIVASESIRELLDGIGGMLSDSGMMDSFLGLGQAVRNALGDLGPAFANLTDIFDMLARMGAAVIEALVPGINTATEMIKVFLEGFHGGFIELIATLQEVASAFHHMLIEPLRIVGEAVGIAMSAIAAMPTEVLLLVGAFAALITPMMKANNLFKAITDGLRGQSDTNNPFASVSTAVMTMSDSFKKADFSGFSKGMKTAKDGAKDAASGIKNAFSGLGNNIASSMLLTVGAYDASQNAANRAKDSAGSFGKSWDGAKNTVKGAVGGIKSGLSGLSTAIGGLVSLPSLGITAALALATTAMADAQAGADKAKYSVKGFAESFDRELNAFGETSVKHFRDRFDELGQHWGTKLGFADDFKDVADKVGISLDELAQNFQGSKQDITDYAGTWNHVGSEIDKALNSSSFDFKTKFQATREVMTNLSDDMLKKMKITREEIEAMDDVELTKFVESMRQAGGEALEALESIEDFSDSLTNINNIDMGNVWDWANNGGAEMAGVREALSEANEQVGRLDSNFKVLGDTGSSVAQKLSAFKDNLKLTGAETFSDTGGLKEYYAGLEQVKSAYDKIKEATDGNIGSLMTFSTETGKLNAQFDFTQQAARDLHDALGKDAEGIQAIGISAYDAALKNTGSVEKAIGAAKEAMAGPVEELKSRLREMGITSEDQINSIIDSLGLLPEDVEMALSVDGAAEARRQIIETQLAAEAISRGDFKVYLEVMSDDAKKALSDFLGTADLNNKVEVEAALKKKGFDMDYNQLMTQVALAPDEVSMLAMLEDRASGPAKEINESVKGLEGNKSISVDLKNDVQSQVDIISKSLNTMTENPKNIELKTNAQETAEKALAELKRLDEANPDLNLDADISALQAKVDSAKAQILSVDDKKVVIEAIDNATPALGHWNSMQPHGKQAVLDLIDNASAQVSGFNQMSAEDKEATIRAIDEANPKAMAWQALSLEEKKAILSVYDEASTAVDSFNHSKDLIDKYGRLLPEDEVTAAVENFNLRQHLMDKNSTFKAIDEVTPKVWELNSIPLNTKTSVMNVLDNATQHVQGFNSMSLENKLAAIKAVDEATPKVSLWHTLSMEDKAAAMSVVDNANPKRDAWNFGNFNAKSTSVTADDNANPKRDAWNNGVFSNKTATAKAIDMANPVMGLWNNGLMSAKSSVMSVIDNARPALAGWNNSPIQNKQALMTAIDRATGVQQSFEANGIDPKVGILNANSEQARAVQAAFEAIPLDDKNSLLTANNRPAVQSQAEFDRIPIQDKLSILTSDATKAIATQRGYESIPIDGKESRITADNSEARRKVQEANSWSLKDKFFNIRSIIPSGVKATLAKVGIHLAQGGILPGNAGIQAFANGGFSDPNIVNSISAFAGGTERHVAQIARGQTPYRVWAEPETGGEAYIPLAKSKRKRSMKILEQVARYFGMSLMKFNKGGIVRKASGGSIRSFADGGSDLIDSLNRDRQSIAEGLTSLKLDMFKVFGSPEKSPIVQSLDTIEKTLRDFATTYRKTAPSQRERALSVVRMIDKQQTLSSAWKSRMGEGFTADFIAKQARFNESNEYGSKIPIGKIWTMADMEKALGILTKKLEDQKAVLERIKSDRDSMQKSIASNLFSSFNISDTVQSADNTGWRAPTSAASVATYAKNKLATMKKYGSKMKDLIKAGYNKSIVMDIAGMKPEDAIYLADALLKDKSYMNTINSAYTQMFGMNGDKNIDGTTGEGYVAGYANITGKYLADSFYGAGIQAHQGLVDGLTKDVSAVERAAKVMADSLTTAFKNAMGIRSPSRVMKELGEFIPQGLALGIDSGRGLVDNSMSRMIRTSDLNLTARPASYHASTNSGIIGGATAPGATINVYPSQGLSETQIGQAASRELLYRSLG